MDYAHPLQFGTFITPVNTPPRAAVDRAILSEQLGFDLATFQDHPYQPGFHDTWTLLTWVAAETSSIRLSGNVLNLPLRQPAVLARAAASLDLLSGGRLELGLGAGGFWDAIVGMGGPRRSPGEGVVALSEAIDIIRGIWDAGNRAPLRMDGEHYSVAGAKRGPFPAHDIPIWLGAYKPRMLRLVGEKADGWLPSLAYMEPGALREGNARIDDAASAAGRDPREIRRLLNVGGQLSSANRGMLQGPAAQWVEQLLELAIEDGVSTFILSTDEAAVMKEFASEVMPALREAVARERAAGGVVAGVARAASSIALRREGIAYDDVPASLTGSVIEPGDFGFSSVRSTYMRGGNPGIVLQPRSVEQIVDAVAFARRHTHLPLAVRSGGHGLSGRSTNDGGLVIDVSRLNSIEVLDEAERLVRIGPGARWADVAATLATHGWALSSGDYGGVGVGGLATAGGIGWLARGHGLTIDHVRAVEIVLASGEVVRASATENPELFWGVRGAGANFGIVSSFEFEVDVVGEVGWAQLAFDASDTAGFLERWGHAVEASPREVTSFVILGGRSPGQPRIAQIMTVVDSDDPDTIIELLQPFATIAPLVDQSVQLLPYATVMANAHGDAHSGRGEPTARSGLIEHVTPGFASAAAELLENGVSYFFQLRSVGGAVADVAEDATAYAHRSANFSVVAFGSDPVRLDDAWTSLDAHFSGLYLSFETSLGDERIERAFPPATLARLRELKQRFDPDNLFRDNFNIVPPEAIMG